MQNNKKTILIIVGIIVALILFYAGTLYGESKSSTNVATRFPGNFGQVQNGTRFNQTNGSRIMNGGGLLSGEIISKDDKSVTIKTNDGGSKIIFLDSGTTVSKMAEGSASDLTNGEQISVTGSQNSDGSLTAKTIQIRPLIRQNTGQNMPMMQ